MKGKPATPGLLKLAGIVLLITDQAHGNPKLPQIIPAAPLPLQTLLTSKPFNLNIEDTATLSRKLGHLMLSSRLPRAATLENKVIF